MRSVVGVSSSVKQSAAAALNVTVALSTWSTSSVALDDFTVIAVLGSSTCHTSVSGVTG